MSHMCSINTAGINPLFCSNWIRWPRACMMHICMLWPYFGCNEQIQVIFTHKYLYSFTQYSTLSPMYTSSWMSVCHHSNLFMQKSFLHALFTVNANLMIMAYNSFNENLLFYNWNWEKFSMLVKLHLSLHQEGNPTP